MKIDNEELKLSADEPRIKIKSILRYFPVSSSPDKFDWLDEDVEHDFGISVFGKTQIIRSMIMVVIWS